MTARWEVLKERKFRQLADMYRDDVLVDGFSLYYHKGIIDSDAHKSDIQAAIEASEHSIPMYVPELREFLEYVIRTGERGPVQGWPNARI